MADQLVLTFYSAAESEALSLLLPIRSRTGVSSGCNISLLLSRRVTV